MSASSLSILAECLFLLLFYSAHTSSRTHKMSQPGHEHETPVPSYTETDEDGFSARLQAFREAHPEYPVVPVTKHPGIPDRPQNYRRSASGSTELWQSAGGEAHGLQADIITALFAAIAGRNTAAVHHLISQGLISPDCPSRTGETPLLASIRARSAPAARTLLALGADANLLGKAVVADPGRSTIRRGGGDGGGADAGAADRTPLMLAAATGQLATVRLLVGDFGADDAVVGPRGETALRLAAAAGHGDVVRYLPARRGGAWRRLRHSKEVVALRRAARTAGKVVRFLAWDLPRLTLVVLPWKVAKFVWKRRGRIGRWVLRVVREVPGMVRDFAKSAWRGVKKLPGLAWRGIKALPRAAWEVIVWISEVVPRALGIVWKGLVDGARKVGRAVAFAARRLVSVLHSFFAAVISRLRDIKLRDVWHDLLVAMEAFCVKLPGAVWAFMCQSVVVAGRAIKSCFTSRLTRALLKLVCILPKALWSMLEKLWASFGRGVDELMTLVNPKRVSSRASRS